MWNSTVVCIIEYWYVKEICKSISHGAFRNHVRLVVGHCQRNLVITSKKKTGQPVRWVDRQDMTTM